MNRSTKTVRCCILAVALASCRNETIDEAENAGGNIATSPKALYTITALPVAYSGPGVVVGKIHVIPSPSGIETDGLGGGCLIFEDPAGPSCKVDSDCKVPSYIKTPGPWAYCASNKCWIKPADKAQCWKSKPPNLLTIGAPVETPETDLSTLPDELFTGPAKDKVDARVGACLNGKFVPGPGVISPCGGGPGKVIHDYGPVRTLTK